MFLNALNNQIKKENVKEDENGNKFIDISLPKFILDSVKSMSKEDIEKAHLKIAKKPLTSSYFMEKPK